VRVAQVFRGGCPQLRERASEAQHMRELLSLALLSPHLVVAVLGPASAVDAGGLDVAKRVGRDPDVLPGWRDAQRTDALESRVVRDRRARGIAVVKAFGSPFADDAGSVRVATCEARNGGG